MSYPDSKDYKRPADSLEEAFGNPRHTQRPQQGGGRSFGNSNPFFGAQGRPNPFGTNSFHQPHAGQAYDQGIMADMTDNVSPQMQETQAIEPLISEEELAALKARITELESETKDIQARANAEMYNFQKRAEREAENSRKYALEKFAGSLLEVVDNLERSIEASATPDDPLTQGVQLTLKALLATLEKYGVEMVNPVNAPFNADLHQAVGIAPGVPANQVGSVLQKGYTLNGRLLRPAIVMVGQ